MRARALVHRDPPCAGPLPRCRASGLGPPLVPAPAPARNPDASLSALASRGSAPAARHACAAPIRSFGTAAPPPFGPPAAPCRYTSVRSSDCLGRTIGRCRPPAGTAHIDTAVANPAAPGPRAVGWTGTWVWHRLRIGSWTPSGGFIRRPRAAPTIVEVSSCRLPSLVRRPLTQRNFPLHPCAASSPCSSPLRV